MMSRTEPIRVSHAKYGKGVVQLPVGSGQVRVYFDSIGGTRVVPENELQPLGASSHVRGNLPERPQLAAVPSDASGRRAERLTLECLRLGLPPRGRVEAWTVGFSDVRTVLGTAIYDLGTSAKGSAIVVQGSYGQGKSHAGEFVREIALKRGLMVLRADLDGQGITLARSGRLLARLLASLELPSGDRVPEVPGLGSLLRRAASQLRGRVPPGCQLLGPVLEHATEWEGSEETMVLLEDYLAGERSRVQLESELRQMLPGVLRLPSLRTNWGTVEARIGAQMEVLSAIIALGVATGAAGALLILDEFDHEIHSREWPRATGALRALVDLPRRAPLVIVLLSPSNLPLPDVRHLMLKPLDSGALRSLTLRTVDAYRAAFPGKLAHGGEEELFQRLLGLYKKAYEALGWGPRFFVRAAVEACDRAAVQKRSLERAVD
jgi:BREX system ATP-binding protein BrxC/D